MIDNDFFLSKNGQNVIPDDPVINDANNQINTWNGISLTNIGMKCLKKIREGEMKHPPMGRSERSKLYFVLIVFLIGD